MCNVTKYVETLVYYLYQLYYNWLILSTARYSEVLQ